MIMMNKATAVSRTDTCTRLSTLLLAGLLLLDPAWALEVVWDKDFTGYTVMHKDVKLFSAGDVAVFTDGMWSSARTGSLKLVSGKPVSGQHPALGSYTGTEVTWEAGTKKTAFVTTSKTYQDDLTVTFEQAWPNGAANTSLVVHNASGSKSNQEVIANFPTFTMDSISLPNTLSWAGSFVGAQQNRSTKVTGSTGGPTVFFNAMDEKHQTVVVLSPLDNFKASSAGPGYTWDGSQPAFAPGTAGTITSIPTGYSATYVARVGSSRGITAAIGEWGSMLQSVHQTYKIPDITLEKIGYQTDNGAAYVFCRAPPPYKNCNELLIAEIKQLKAAGVPMGYLSFQGAGSSTMSERSRIGVEHEVGNRGVTSAPWCVNEWGPDLNMSQRHGAYPMDEGQFQKATGVPLQLYAPYFCPESKYFQRNNPSSQWIGVTSDNSLPGCGSYGFQDATPQESRKFYDWFFDKGVAVGMVSFEPDFMNQNYNCVPDFIESVSNSDTWQHGMTDAALAKNLTVQWCYAAPTDVLNSLTMPALTNFRVSTDFCYGRSWDIGVSSLIVWAVGAFPSKDTLWTTDNGRFSVPGCPWTPDHEDPAAELHVVLALMSTGPVGISDKIGMTNVDLIKRTITADGTLLKPSKAVTSIDSALAAASGLQDAPSGFVYHTYTGESLSEPTSWIFVSFKMTSAYEISELDFYPALTPGTSLVTRTFKAGATCQDGTDASSCVEVVKDTVAVPQSDHSNVTGGTDYAPAVISVWPICPGGSVFLGDLTKYVSASSNRFRMVKCTDSGIDYKVVGSAGEVVPVTTLTGVHGKVKVTPIKIPNSGEVHISFNA